MQIIITVIMAIATISTAKADGFKCQGLNTGVMVKVYNHTQPSEGTRSVAIMIVSDSNIGSPNKTIAKFTDENKTLAYKGAGLFQAKVDLRYQESSKKGENIAGTKLGELKKIELQLFSHTGYKFTYDIASTFAHADAMNARLSYIKRNGEILEEKALCTRYLKD